MPAPNKTVGVYARGKPGETVRIGKRKLESV